MNILAFGAHPDDIELLCAGTLARFAQANHSITMAVMCNGDAGSTTLPPQEIQRIRDDESRKAAALIGATYYNVGFSDVRIHSDDVSKDRIIEVIRKVHPDLIITHDPNDYMSDHQVTGQLVEECSFMATVPNIKTENPAYMVNIPIYYMDTLAGLGFAPEVFVDISDVFEAKRKMLECHASQTTWLRDHDAVDVMEMMEITARFRGIQAGVRYAEAFRGLRKWGRTRTTRLLP